MKKLVILSGAGISAESGISTFRDSNGLWENHDVQEVASPQGWRANKELVLRFYNDRRRQLLECEPNDAHRAIAELEKYFNVTVITQNVDDLHERGGATDVVHLHGELLKVRSEEDDALIYDWHTDLTVNDRNDKGHSLRPHIVWFGEMVPELPRAAELVSTADVVIIIGTSLQVYPAASLIDYAPSEAVVYYIDPRPACTQSFHRNIQVIPASATEGMKIIWGELMELSAD
ncbi:MAG: NAD-dependent deacylase [Chryseobacterium sp.]|nr:MAG: NAD-dependent deacylase [Chryseobacterium sp.]